MGAMDNAPVTEIQVKRDWAVRAVTVRCIVSGVEYLWVGKAVVCFWMEEQWSLLMVDNTVGMGFLVLTLPSHGPVEWVAGV